jgi:uncharacterized protein YlzI (FlbEa/FlbD family)
MKFIRATRRTNGAVILINLDHITAMQCETLEATQFTAVILHNGREIDVRESPEELLQGTGPHMLEV